MKRTFRILCNFVCMLTLVALVLSSCDLRDFETIPPGVTAEDDSPAATTPSETKPSETTTPEITTPEETAPAPTDKHTHIWGEWIIIKEAKCEVKGLLQRHCDECYYTESKPIDVLGHTKVVDKAVAVTCTTDGLTEGKHCSTCGKILVRQQTISATGHSWDEGKLSLDFTCTEGGIKTFTCKVCEKTKTEPVTGHSYMVDYVNNPARFEKTWGICTVCGYIDEDHEHSIKDGKCEYCDYEFKQFEVPSTFDNDGDGNVDVFYFSAALPETFTGEDVIWINAVNDALANDNHTKYDEVLYGYLDTPLPYPNVYCHQDSDDELVYTINVEKAGLYNVAIHYRLKDQRLRGATFVVNEGTATEQSIPHTYGWDTTDEAFEVRNNWFLMGAYMTGLVFNLHAGENTITIRVVDGAERSQLFRDLYLVPVD